MLNLNEICTGCMSNKGRGKRPKDICPFCGYFEIKRPVTHLSNRTILKKRYFTGKALSEGNYGITYLGLDLKTESKVAVKEYFPKGLVLRNSTDKLQIDEKNIHHFKIGLEEFSKEAQLLEKYNEQKNIINLRDFFYENNTAYIITTYLDGLLLSDLLKSGPLKEAYTIEVMLQVLEGLQIIHEKGVIHRDIKPENIFLEKNGQANLLDFGASEFFENSVLKTFPAIGTPGFAPPEQYTSENCGPWTDIYACGATLYMCITGVMPVDSVVRTENVMIIPPEKLRTDISAGFSTLILKALEPDATARIQTAAELKELLNEVYQKVSSEKFLA